MSDWIIDRPIAVHALLAVVFALLYLLSLGTMISLLFSGLAGFFVGIVLAKAFIALMAR